MDEVLKALQNIQSELAQNKRDMKDMEENIKRDINKNIDEKFHQIEIKTNQIEQKLEAQQKTIDFLDKQMRRKNIVFFGIPEIEKSYEDLLNCVLEIINKKMDLACPKWEIETVLRLGKNNGRIRPVVVTMSTTSRKLQLLKKKKSLESTGIYIKEDYSPAVLQRRKELQEELKRRRLSGEKVILRHDKIVQIKSREQPSQTSKQINSNHKRSLPESPEAEITGKTSDSNEVQAKQAPKKNKSQTISSFLRPSQLNPAPHASKSRDYYESSKN